MHLVRGGGDTHGLGTQPEEWIWWVQFWTSWVRGACEVSQWRHPKGHSFPAVPQRARNLRPPQFHASSGRKGPLSILWPSLPTRPLEQVCSCSKSQSLLRISSFTICICSFVFHFDSEPQVDMYDHFPLPSPECSGPSAHGKQNTRIAVWLRVRRCPHTQSPCRETPPPASHLFGIKSRVWVKIGQYLALCGAIIDGFHVFLLAFILKLSCLCHNKTLKRCRIYALLSVTFAAPAWGCLWDNELNLPLDASHWSHTPQVSFLLSPHPEIHWKSHVWWKAAPT